MTLNLPSILLLLTAAVFCVGLARRLKLPSILAYLAIGIAAGPHGFGLLNESREVDNIAEFGIVFLMFSIGMEFSLQRLNSMRGLVFGFGGAQVLLTTLGVLLGTWIGYGQGWRAGVAVGLAVAMSSTAIVARMLSERLELHSRSGRQTMGVLLFQDLAVVPCLIVLPALAAPGDGLLRSLGIAFVQAALLLTALIWIGQHVMGRLFDRVAERRSDELFMLTTLWVVVGLAWLTEHAGLSMALGAFVGGMLISETTYRHHISADIRPFRDMLLGLFFVTVGMMLDMRFVLTHAHMLLLALLLLVTGKGLVMLAITAVVRTPLSSGLRTAAQVAQGGEFGLVLINLAYSLHLIHEDVFQVTLSAMLLSMFAAPFLIAQTARLAGELGRGDWAHRAKAITDIASRTQSLGQHVIICGFGRTGRRIGECLEREGIPFIAIELDPQRLERAQSEGRNVAFGNADRKEVLQAAGLDRARAVVVTYPDLRSSERVILTVRHQQPDIPLIVRTPHEKDVSRLKQMGASQVVSEVLEGGLLMATETLTLMGVSQDRALAHAEETRQARYAAVEKLTQQSSANKAR